MELPNPKDCIRTTPKLAKAPDINYSLPPVAALLTLNCSRWAPWVITPPGHISITLDSNILSSRHLFELIKVGHDGIGSLEDLSYLTKIDFLYFFWAEGLEVALLRFTEWMEGKWRPSSFLYTTPEEAAQRLARIARGFRISRFFCSVLYCVCLFVENMTKGASGRLRSTQYHFKVLTSKLKGPLHGWGDQLSLSKLNFIV